MNHPEVRRRMGEYLQGDLTLAQRALFDAHLDGCDACAEDLRALRETIRLLRELPTPEVPPHLADRVVARIADGEGRARWWDGLASAGSRLDPTRYLPPLAAAALTSAVVIVGVRDLGWQIPGTQVPGPAERPAATAPPPDLRMQTRAQRPAPDLRMQTRAQRPAPDLRMQTRAQPAESAEPRAPGLRSFAAAPAAPAADAAEEEALEVEVIEDPHLFLERYRALQAERRDAWLARMAERAARRSRVEDVARRLREQAGPEGRALADRFEEVAYPAGR